MSGNERQAAQFGPTTSAAPTSATNSTSSGRPIVAHQEQLANEKGELGPPPQRVQLRPQTPKGRDEPVADFLSRWATTCAEAYDDF